jgi:hypothetical protein
MHALIPALGDSRYIRVNGKPLLSIYRASLLPDPLATTDRWREEFQRAGLGELYLARVESYGEDGDPRQIGFDDAIEFHPQPKLFEKPLRHTRFWHWLMRFGLSSDSYEEDFVFDYSSYVRKVLSSVPISYPRMPCVMPSWDNSPRRCSRAYIFVKSRPSIYSDWLASTLRLLKPSSDGDRLVFINAWNEWGEGAHLEPCSKWGTAYLDATRSALHSFSAEENRISRLDVGELETGVRRDEFREPT